MFYKKEIAIEKKLDLIMFIRNTKIKLIKTVSIASFIFNQRKQKK